MLNHFGISVTYIPSAYRRSVDSKYERIQKEAATAYFVYEISSLKVTR